MEMIRFQNVKKAYDKPARYAVNDISFSVQEGELITMLGSSGCGKTTTLKMINRLVEPDEGTIFVQGQNVNKVDPISLRKSIGYVIQQGGLFPHMRIKENILTVCNLLKWSKEQQEVRLTELFQMIDLDQREFQNRYPNQLSGGQQQRIGIARALAANPKLVLLDEPFGALDAITRSLLQDELKKLHKKTHATMLFVTHDIGEALLLGDRVMIMHEGQICQFDTPKEILGNPSNAYVAQLIRSFKQQVALTEMMKS